MTYSDGTPGNEPNMFAHDLSCFPQGLSIEKYSDRQLCLYMFLCVSAAAVCECVSTCDSMCAYLFYKLAFTTDINVPTGVFCSGSLVSVSLTFIVTFTYISHCPL